jgi:hypothetical protein
MLREEYGKFDEKPHRKPKLEVVFGEPKIVSDFEYPVCDTWFIIPFVIQ